MSRALLFTVFGKAMPGGSKRAFRNPKARGKLLVVDDNPKSKDWRGEVRREAGRVMQKAGRTELMRGALAVTMTFYRARPASHFGTGRNAGRLKPSAPQYPTSKPDLLKVTRSTEDALTGVVWSDDAIIVDHELRKRYGEPERCDITVIELEAGRR